jgi:hypothetical protein
MIDELRDYFGESGSGKAERTSQRHGGIPFNIGIPSMGGPFGIGLMMLGSMSVGPL